MSAYKCSVEKWEAKEREKKKEWREKIMFNFLHGEYFKAWNYIQSSAAQAGLVCMEPISWVWLGGCVCVCVCVCVCTLGVMVRRSPTLFCLLRKKKGCPNQGRRTEGLLETELRRRKGNSLKNRGRRVKSMNTLIPTRDIKWETTTTLTVLGTSSVVSRTRPSCNIPMQEDRSVCK